MKKQRLEIIIGISLLFIALWARILFIHFHSDVLQYPDSHGYLYAAYAFFNTTHSLADHWRTPVYPLYLWMFTAVNQADMTQPFAEILSLSGPSIAFGQLVFSVFGLSCVYFYLKKIGVPIIIRVVLGVFIAVNPVLIHFERALLTESLSVVWFCLFLILSYYSIKRMTITLTLLLLVFAITGVMLRPSMLFVPIISWIFLLAVYRSKKIFLYVILSVVVYGGVLGLYAMENERVSSYRGITTTSSINLLGRVLTLGLPIQPIAEPTEWDKVVIQYRQERTVMDPWLVLGFKPELNHIYFLKQLSPFAQRVILDNVGQYIRGSLKDIPTAYRAVTEGIDKRNSVPIKTWVNMYGVFNYIHLLILITAPWYIGRCFYKAKRSDYYKGYVWIILLSYTLSTVFFAYDDWGRHLIVLEPFFVAAYGIFAFDVSRWLRMLHLLLAKIRTKNN